MPAPATPAATAPAAPLQAAPAQPPAPEPPVRSEPAPVPASPAPLPTRPAWLGTRVLPLAPNGFGEVRPTPRVLRDRRLPTVDLLPPPAGDDFAAAVVEVPAKVARRSTWTPGCPVALEDLRYVTVAFRGFDQRPHTGELLVHASVADDVVSVFRRLYRARFPIEEMRVVAPAELDAPPTGDGNNTTAFVCRATRGATSWSEHAYGLAVDVNPFHNPYVKGDVLLPELASAYVDRRRHRPGMIASGDVVTRAFARIGWTWGGTWTSLSDWMHFSRDGT